MYMVFNIGVLELLHSKSPHSWGYWTCAHKGAFIHSGKGLIPLSRHKSLPLLKPYSHMPLDLHMFRIVPTMALYFKMGKAQGCKVELNYYWILGSLFWECPNLKGFTLHIRTIRCKVRPSIAPFSQGLYHKGMCWFFSKTFFCYILVWFLPRYHKRNKMKVAFCIGKGFISRRFFLHKTLSWHSRGISFQ